jgi:tape measure domain-containing protein
MSNVGVLSADFEFDFSQLTKGFDKALRQVTNFEKHAARSFTAVNKRIDGLVSSFFSLKTALAGAGLGLIAKGFLDTAASVEKLKVSLDTITKGKGQATFDALNQWAIDMPINTQKAIETFINLKAMGLDPTLETMTTLVDTTSALGGSEETLASIARALGQITTKGKLSAEELMQLAEQGIPAYEILAQKFNLTGKQLANIGNAGIDAKKAVAALVEGMAERFGGQAARMMTSWSGLMESFKAQVSEFQRQVMESGPFQVMKEGLKSFLDYFNTAQGKLDLAKWAHNLSIGILKAFDMLLAGIQTFDTAVKPILSKMWDEITHLWTTFKSLPAWVQEAGLVGAIVGGKKGLVILGGAVHLLETFRNSYDGLVAVLNGDISFKEYATANKEELEKLLETVNKAKAKISEPPDTVKGKVTEAATSIDGLRAKLQELINTPFQYKPMGKLELPQTGTAKPKTATGDEASNALVNAQKNALRKLQQVTLTDVEFKKWAIQQEIADFKDGVAKKYSTEAEFQQFRTAKLEEIKQLELETSGTVADGWVKGWEESMTKMGNSFSQGKEMAMTASTEMEGSFKTLFADGMKGNLDDIGDYFSNFCNHLLNTFIDMQAEMMAKSLMSSIFGGLTGGGGFLGGLFGFAKGGAFVDGVQAFASGGIVNSPTLFPMKTGMGLMGEAGAEAIMPLTRDRSGNLGVKAVGSGMAAQNIEVKIVNESGHPMKAKSASINTDMQRQILTVVMDGVSRNVEGSGDFFGKT